MTVEQLEAIFYHRPFRPFRLVLDDGEEVVCRKPRKSLVSGDQIAVVGICRRPNGGGMEKLRMVNIERVRSAELLPAEGT